MKNKSLLDSFNHALTGVITTLKTERNFKIHFAATFSVLFMILFMDLNAQEFLLVLSSIALVLTAELFNTAIEAVVDLVCGERYEKKAKIAKDAAAGGVFIAALYSVVVGYVVIIRKLVEADYTLLVKERIRQTPIYITLICILLVVMLTILLKALSGRDNLLKGGMPSAHAAVAFSLATCIFFLTADGVAIALAYLLALLVAQSRVEGKIHSLLQVLLGGLLGIFITVLIFQFIHF